MGSVLSDLFFINPSDDVYGFLQICFLGMVYAYILCYGSNMIKDGSELLLLIPSLAGVVGSIVLPVLGAVPDGAIVLFSGMGKDAKTQIQVGIGALAGSTIMLLTIPWQLSIWAGRVNLDADGNGNYVRPQGVTGWKKLEPANRILGAGVNCGASIKYTSKVMLLTLIPFFIIQVPALVGNCATKNDGCHTPHLASLIGAIFATLLFFFYLWDQARIAPIDEVKEDKTDQLRANAVKNGHVSLRGLFPEKVMDNLGVMEIKPDSKRFQAFLRPFFRKFDADNSGAIDREEFSLLAASLGEHYTKSQLDVMMKQMDKDGNGLIEFSEFTHAMADMLVNGTELSAVGTGGGGGGGGTYGGTGERTEGGTSSDNAGTGDTVQKKEEMKEKKEKEEEEGEEEDEEEPEIPDDLADLSPKEQQRRILMRSCWQMGAGVFIVLLFSDPMVGVLSKLGDILHIKPFYVAFILAPLASNASELIAAYSYALKKTEKTITISFSSLLGAACMNNSFCLAIFLFLVYCIDLQWEFSAETISILVVELIMFGFAQKRVHQTWYGFAVVALFPLSVALVAGLEAAGLD